MPRIKETPVLNHFWGPNIKRKKISGRSMLPKPPLLPSPRSKERLLRPVVNRDSNTAFGTPYAKILTTPLSLEFKWLPTNDDVSNSEKTSYCEFWKQIYWTSRRLTSITNTAFICGLEAYVWMWETAHSSSKCNWILSAIFHPITNKSIFFKGIFFGNRWRSCSYIKFFPIGIILQHWN